MLSNSKLDIEGIGMTSQRTRDRLKQRLKKKGIINNKVLKVIASIPRHLFIDEAIAHKAYEDTALPIGFGQTISQPHTVALMTETLLDADQTTPYSVLEVGTGCGYQTSVLAALFGQVYTIERIGGLHQQAKQILKTLNIFNVEFRHTDGTGGWPNVQYRFDRILMAAACKEVPEKLFEQLKIEGVMVYPYDTGNGQQLIKATRHKSGIKTEVISKVSFVPLLDGTI